ncbi:MAG TPA: AAA family ATPase [Gaiellaceae bacterium]|nr:AAA family ATPase [Gaiellaceae bacterium]
MRRPLRTVVTLDTNVDPREIAHALSSADGFEIVQQATGAGDRRAALAGPADLVVVGCDGDSDRAIELVAEAVAHRSDRPVVVLSSHPPNGLMERLFAAGADDIVVLPEDPQRVAFAIEKAVARKHGPGATKAGRIVTVLGPKGGTGKTLLSANLGVALAKEGRRTTAVDLDLQFGDLALTLGLEPRRTLYDLARAGGGLDAGKLDGFAVKHRSGLRALLAPVRPDEAAAVGGDLLAQVWETLRSTEDYVVVDTCAGFPPEAIAAIDAATDLVLVGTLDAGSLKDSKLGLETLALMGHDPAGVLLVLNRSGSRVGIEPRDVEQILGRAPDVSIPSDRTVTRSVNEGRPIVASSPRSSAARAITQLAHLLLAREAGQPLPGMDGLTRRAA